jgi:UDP-glucuronate 4-epimerase
MRYLVTGNAGFIGSALVQKLISEGHHVSGVDSMSNYYDISLKKKRLEVFPASKNYFGEIEDQVFLNRVLDEVQPEAVVHLAAQPGVRLPTAQIIKYVSSNLVGFSMLLSQIVLREIPTFLYASSSSVYGDTSEPPYSEKELKIFPNSFYGVTKYANELLTPTLIQGSKTRARGMRFFTVYGPWGRPDMAYFRMVSNVLTGSPFELFGDGNIKRDFTYIDDVVHSVVALQTELIGRDHGFNDVVNIGGGHPVSMLEVLHTISEIVGKKVEYHNGEPNLKDVALTISDPSYLYQLTSYRPLTDISTGLTKFINWGNESHIRPLLSQWVHSVE